MSAVDDMLASARARIRRKSPDEARLAMAEGALLIDIRYAELWRRDGAVPGALVIERNELEWRLDPTCPHRAPQATGFDVPAIIMCNEGYASSLAALSLATLGLRDVSDMTGGFQAWRAAGLPVDRTTSPAPIGPHDGH